MKWGLFSVKSAYVSQDVCETFICIKVKWGKSYGKKLHKISFKRKKNSLLCCMLMLMCCSKKKVCMALKSILNCL